MSGTPEADQPGNPAAIILAAGGSARMGTPKQLLTYSGQTLIRRAAEAAVGASCAPVVVVLGNEPDAMAAELLGLPVTTAVNDDWSNGIGSSIRSGVRRLLELSPKTEATLLVLCDQPLVTADALARLAGTRRQSGKPVVVSAYAGTIGPPVCVGREFFADLLTLPDDQGAKAVWVRRPDAVVEVPCDEAGVDVDTPADYQRLRAGLSCGAGGVW